MITIIITNERGRQKRENHRHGSSGETWPAVADFEDEGRGQELRNVKGF